METSTAFFGKVLQQFENRLPFVVYNKPNSERLVGIFQQNDALHFVNDFTETGFIFAPFNGDQIVLIPESKSEVVVIHFKIEALTPIPLPISEILQSAEKANFEDLVKKGIVAIGADVFSKVVLSRKEVVALQNFDLLAILKKLLNQYPAAFTYCFFHPQVGLWLGSFSEQLLRMEAQHFQTMAVAGTQPSHDNDMAWGNKERAEQLFVTDFITKHLEDKVSEMKISEPYTLKAGSVMHIKTDIEGKLNAGLGLREMIEILHPTPAVCGLPKAAARNFILQYERYDREYYSGFFGELHKDFDTDSEATNLYVNLRCMQIKNEQAFIYVGGGITRESVPAEEWQETVNKAQTMKRILEPEI